MNIRKTAIITVVLSFSTMLSAKPNITGQNALKTNNLKGSVQQVVEYECDFKENFGEWVVSGKHTIRFSLFSREGNYLLDVNTNRKDKAKMHIYDYGAYGISRVTCGVGSRSTFSKEDIADMYVALLTGSRNTDWRMEKTYEEYDYSAGGNLISITEKWNDDRILSKEVYKYNDEGYETIFYRGDGSKEVGPKYEVSKNGHLVTQVTYNGYVLVYKYDDNYRLEEATVYVKAINGSMASVTYYSYNDKGDVVAYVAGSGGEKMRDGLEAVYPYVKDEYRNTKAGYYEYEYDSYGNWIVKKEFGFRGDEPVVTGWWEREIEYGTNGNKQLKEYWNKAEEVRLAKERKEAEIAAWNARPTLAQPSESLSMFVRSIIKYPDTSNRALTSIFKAAGSSVRILIPVFISAEGETTFPDKIEQFDLSRQRYADKYRNSVQWGLNNQKFYIIGGYKEEEQASKEVTEMLKRYLEQLKAAPIGEKGKKASKCFIYVEIISGGIVQIQITDAEKNDN